MGSTVWPVWSHINRELLQALGESRFAVWVRSARPVQADDDVLRIHFPSTLVLEKMETLCLRIVESAVRRATNRNVRVRFEADPASFPAFALPAPAPRFPQTFENFLAGPGNVKARDAARRFVRGETRAPLLLHAPAGLGKSHLLQAVRAGLTGVRVLLLTGDGFARDRARAERRGTLDTFRKICQACDVLLVDDLHLIAHQAAAARDLAEVIENLRARRRRVALATARHPRRFKALPASIRDRFLSCETCDLRRPDAETSLGLLRRHAGARLPEPALRIIAEGVPFNHKDQLACLKAVLEGRPPWTNAAREAVSDFLCRWSRMLSLEDIARAAARRYDVPLKEIYSNARSRHSSEARKACFFLSRRLLGRSYATIGRHFGRRGHATVVDAYRSLSGKLKADVKSLLKNLERNAPLP